MHTRVFALSEIRVHWSQCRLQRTARFGLLPTGYFGTAEQWQFALRGPFFMVNH